MGRMAELYRQHEEQADHIAEAAPQMLAILRRFVREYDAECACPDDGCLECTEGTTPVHLERGPCPYHAARSLLRNLGVQP